MLIGKYKYSIDSKNRLCIPHKFRENLGTRCVFSKDLTYKCLNLYSMEQWDKYCEKIERLPTIEMEEIRMLVYSNSDEAEIDSQGRIILNKQLCEDIGLTDVKEAMIVGIFNHAQIWNVSEWEIFGEELNADNKRKAVKDELRKIGF